MYVCIERNIAEVEEEGGGVEKEETESNDANMQMVVQNWNGNNLLGEKIGHFHS